ncbi:hypothetical protein G3I76_03590, partial [Streptomyces sp. SID11233]|nr:hypothetical protein [Streptomyces sp. SID11233]
TTGAALENWERAWTGSPSGLLRPALLGDGAVRVLEIRDETGTPRGGAVLHRGAEAVGISHVWASTGEAAVRDTAVAHAATTGLPLVGYE